MSDDIVTWLRACIAEDETYWSEYTPRSETTEQAIRTCAAHRAIIVQYVDAEEAVVNINAIDWGNDPRGRVEQAGYSQARWALRRVVTALAAVYSDRPGWREEWRI